MREFEITNFKGIATDRNNWTKEQCQVCKNFDLREVKGRLTSRQGYDRKYETPGTPGDLSQVTILRAENIVITAGGEEKECTVLVGKGTLDRVSGSGASLTSIDIGLFFIQPYYYDGSWITDEWTWLNECYLTTIDTQGTGATNKNQFHLNGDFDAAANYFAKFSIYDITNGIYSEILESSKYDTNYSLIRVMTDPDNDYTELDKTGSGATVLVMKNFIPYDDLLEYYNATANEITFNKILTDLRIGFGGQADRLGLMIGYREKVFRVITDPYHSTEIDNVKTYDEIILAPYNSLTEDLESSSWASGKTFHIYGNAQSGTPLTDGRWFFKLTGVLDNYEEFVLPAQLYDGGGVNTIGTEADYIDTSTEEIAAGFRIHWGLFNKRMTKIRLYVSGENPASTAPQYPYYFVKEWQLLTSADEYHPFQMNDYGFFSGTFTLDEDTWAQRGAEIDDNLGYVNTLNYARGWDHAVTGKGYCFYLNPYVDKQYNNWVLFSPYSGDGAPQHDVAVLSKYIDFENHDGNLTKGLGILPNLDIGAFKANSFQRGNTIGQVSTDLYPGTGIDSRRSLVNLNSGIALCSQQDIYLTDGAQRKNLSAGGISDTFRDMASRENIFAVREEKEDAYRFWYLTTNQFLYAMDEWVKINTNLIPDDFITSKDGTVWFLSANSIFNHTGYSDVNASAVVQDIDLQWKSIEFDIAKMGGQMPARTRLYVLSVFMKYSSSSNLSVKVYKDGSIFQTLTFSSGSTYDNKVLKHGCTGKVIELEITGSVQAKTEIESIGFYWKPLEYREYV